MEMISSAGTPQENISKITVWTKPLAVEVKGAWRGISLVLHGQDILGSKYPADHSDVVGLIVLSCGDSTFIPVALVMLVTLQ